MFYSNIIGTDRGVNKLSISKNRLNSLGNESVTDDVSLNF